MTHATPRVPRRVGGIIIGFRCELRPHRTSATQSASNSVDEYNAHLCVAARGADRGSGPPRTSGAGRCSRCGAAHPTLGNGTIWHEASSCADGCPVPAWRLQGECPASAPPKLPLDEAEAQIREMQAGLQIEPDEQKIVVEPGRYLAVRFDAHPEMAASADAAQRHARLVRGQAPLADLLRRPLVRSARRRPVSEHGHAMAGIGRDYRDLGRPDQQRILSGRGGIVQRGDQDENGASIRVRIAAVVVQGGRCPTGGATAARA